MAIITIPQAGAFQTLDTSANPNTGVLRDNAGGIAGVQLLGSELKSSGVVTLAFATKTAAFTADTTAYLWRCDATSAAFAATLPPAASCTGRVYVFKKIDNAHNVTVTGSGSETIDGSNTNVLSTQYQTVRIQSNGTSWDVI